MVQTDQGTKMTAEDRYSADIDFSNACREFYINRKQRTKVFKEEVGKQTETPSSENKPKSSMDSAMEKLRKEMAGLMDQDLSLMKQLLTLNETIEEIKFKRLHGGSKDFDRSSCYLNSVEDCSMKSKKLDVPRIEVSSASESLKSWKSEALHGQISVEDSGYDESSSSSDESSSDCETTV